CCRRDGAQARACRSHCWPLAARRLDALNVRATFDAKDGPTVNVAEYTSAIRGKADVPNTVVNVLDRPFDPPLIGAGWAGLGVSYALAKAGLSHRVLERGRIGETWVTQRWDSFYLNTPKFRAVMPGDRYEGADPEGFYTRDEFVALLKDYARRYRLPVATNTPVTALTRDGKAGVYRLITPVGELTARAVVIASGSLTRSIPIVFALVADPIGSGFVASFPRPGGNVTGFVTMEPAMAGKWLELLKEIAPGVARVAFVFNPATATYFEYWLNPFKATAASFAVEAITAPVRDTSELEAVIGAQARKPNGGLIVMPDTFTDAHRVEITSLAARYRLPAVYPYRQFTAVGGLLSYGDDLIDNFRRAPTYVDRILKGAKPSELPVQAPVKFELIINLKTAKTLGLDVPPLLQQRADEVIE